MKKFKLCEVAKEHKETYKGSKTDLPIVGLEHLVPEEIILKNWDVNTDNTFTKYFRKGNVLFGRRRAYLKKAVVARCDGLCSGDITIIEPLPNKIAKDLLPFIIQNDALFDFAVSKSAGSLSPRVKWESLKEFEFSMPDTIEEQEKLAELLWSIVDTSNSYDELLKNTEILEKALFSKLLSQSNVISNVKVKDAVEFLPKSKIKASEGKKEGIYPFYTSSSEQNLWLNDYSNDAECLILATGGKASVIYVNGKFAVSTDNFMIKSKGNIKTKFIYYYLICNMDIVQEGFRGVGLQHLSKEYLNDIEVPLYETEVQDNIINTLNSIEESKNEILASKNRLSNLYKKVINTYIRAKED